ncbi:hypothetical protein CW745_11510 [Psychromonas sp. psych-6C06]|uniref:T1SS-143 repeat domain-containing protein n=1 Tax=Psychromonas sp. psych-6C06 TaxID=2058089 RepID=UPI000C3468C5|nr:hypothetical protein [Psychromonas sp. psych-6C06]PKF61252.1 hypothetical protein CW745_11510 [Psychromonas sp. psych-6C06]
MIDNVLLYVELDGQLWMIMADGSWQAVSDISQVNADLPLLNNLEQIIEQQNSGEVVFSYNNQTYVIDPQALQFGITPSFNPENNRTETNVAYSTGSGLGVTTRLHIDSNEVLADAGYQTRDTAYDDDPVIEPPSSELVGKLDNDAQISVVIESGRDAIINQFEVPLTPIYGSTLNIDNDRQVNIDVTDSAGKTISFYAFVKDNSWSLGEVDLSSLAQGEVRVNAYVADEYGNRVDALTDSFIDTLAEVDVHFESEADDNVINIFQVANEGLAGTVQNVEDGQAINVIVTDVNGYSETFTSTVISGQWAIDNNDLSAFAEGTLSALVTVKDIAGNIATDQISIVKDTVASITLTLETGDDGWLNADEILNASLKGTVNGVEDGQIVTIIATDSDGNIRTVRTPIVGGVYSVSGLDLSGIADGSLNVLATVSDKAGNPATSANTIQVDTNARIVTHIATHGDNLINAAEVTATRIWGFTIQVDDGEPITLTVTDVNGKSLVFSTTNVNSLYSITEDLSALAEGKLTVTASVTDNVGNTATASDDAIKDTIATISINIGEGGDGWLNAAEITEVTLTGNTTGVEDGQTVTVILTDSVGNSEQVNAIVNNGKFIIADVDLSHFVDGDLSASANVSDIAGNPATATDTALIDTLASLSLNINTNGDGVLNATEVATSQLSGHTSDVNDGAMVTIVVTDSAGKFLTFTATVNNNQYSVVADLSSLDEGELIGTATVTDERGNVANANANAQKDTLADITLTIESGGDGVLNQSEISNVSASGSVTNIEDGNQVTIIATDSAGNTGTITAVIVGGQYAFTGLDLSHFVDGDFTVVATISDNAGNPASTQTSVQIDTLATITVVIESGGDDLLNANEVPATTLHGTTNGVENGATVTVSVTDPLGKTAIFTAVVNNNSYQISAADLSALSDGDLQVNAFVTDQHGNKASANTSTVKDTLASITIDVETGNDNTLNATEVVTTTILGTSANIEDGQTVSVLVTDGINTLTFTATINANSWSIAGVDLSTLNEGALSFTATSQDIAGNGATDNSAVNKDTLASVTITTEQESSDSLLNSSESDNENLRGSVTNIENGQFVTVTVTDTLNNVLTFNTQVVAGIWLVPKSELTSLVDGELIAQVTAIDKAGNSSTAQTSIIKDTSAAINVIIESGNDQFINSAEVSAVHIHGTVTDVEDGQTVSLIITDINGNRLSLTPTAVVIGGLWSVDNIDLSMLDDGPFNVDVSVSDIAGNIAVSSATAVKDVLAETSITIDDQGDGYLNKLELSNVVFSGSVTHIEDGQSVTIVLTDSQGSTETLSAIVTNGRWEVTGVDLSPTGSDFAEGILEAQVTVQDVAGNTASASDDIVIDTLAQLSVGIFSAGDNTLNASEVDAVRVFGHVNDVEDGRVVSFTITDGVNTSAVYTATVTGSVWSVANIDFSGFNEGTITVNATVSDIAGNVFNANSTVLKDTLAGITIDIKTDSDTVDQVINRPESKQTEISGSVVNVEDGQLVTVVVVDGAGNSLTFTTTVNAGIWTLPAVDLSSLVDGTNNISATATVSDIAGNSVQAVDSTSKDTLATLTVTIDSGNDNYLNSAEITSGSRIFGDATGIEEGKQVSLTISDQSGNTVLTTAVIAGGQFEALNVDLSGLEDGLLEVDAQAYDTAGNVANAIDNVEKDTDVTIDIDTDSNNGFTNYPGYNTYDFMTGAHTTLGGTTNAEVGQVVTLTVSDGTNSVSFTAAVDNSGRWLVENIDISPLDNSLTWQMQVDVDDIAGNHASDAMPTLNLADEMILDEQALNRTSASASTLLDIHSDNTVLSFTDNQPQLAAITSEGQSVTATLSSDGLSIEVRRDEDGRLVLNATIDPVSSSASVTIFEAVDHSLGSDSLVTELFIKALQTDDDGTTERSVMPIVFTINDSIPNAVNDTYTLTEAQTATGNLLSNDTAIDGDPVVNNVTFNGVTWPITAGNDAVIDTGKGILSVAYDGSWRFVASNNLDNTVLQQISFDYQIIDYDGDTSDANVVFDIVDGHSGIMSNQSMAHRESTVAQQTDHQKVFIINAGSDDLVASSIVFLSSTIDALNNLSLQSNGETITYSLNVQENIITAMTVNGAVFSISLNAVSQGADLKATATFTQNQPIDHTSSDKVFLALGITAFDIDGTEITYGVLNWAVNDGDNAIITNDSEATLDEADLTLGAVIGQGSFSVNPGSDETVSVAFDISKQPSLTAGGLSILYKVDVNSKLIAYTDNPEETVFTVEIIGSLETQTMSDLDYQVTLFKAIDQLSNNGQHVDILNIPIVVSVTDGDNDISDQNLLINISDSGAPIVAGGALHVSEQPLAPTTPNSFNNTDTTLVNISADLDPIVDVKLDVSNNGVVLLSDGSTLMRNGESVLWQESSDGNYKGVLANGTIIFELTLSENINISAGTSADVALTFTLIESVDHDKVMHDNNLDITLPLVVIDSDQSQIIHDINLSIDDGKKPSLFVSDNLNVDENVLLTEHDKDSIQYQLDQGSDDIVAVEPLLAGQLIPNLFSAGQSVTLASSANSDGWWIASTNSSDVLKVRFNLNGTIDLRLLDVVDHPADGADTLTLSLAIQALDSDGDVSRLINNLVDINIVDDVPEVVNTLMILEEGETTQLNLLGSQAITGADGASVTAVNVDSIDYLPGNWITLATSGGTVYGRILINADGTGTLETYSNVYHPGFGILDNVNYTVTDGDGDSVVSRLLMDIADEEGEVTITNTTTLEDNSLALNLTVSVGDLDNNEQLLQVVFTATSLQGGSLTLNGNPLATNVDGDYILTTSDFTVGVNGLYTPTFPLLYHPLLNSSDQTQTVTLEVTAQISKDGSADIVTPNSIPLTITSVADTPTWDDANSDYQYTLLEDGGAQPVALNADLFDVDGSETLTYQIGSIEAGLTLTILGSKVNSGDVLTQVQLTQLKATPDANFAGVLTFTVTPIATESENNDSAQGIEKTISFNVQPIADTPELAVVNAKGLEDEVVLLNSVLNGNLTDTDGSETLSYIITVATDWSVVAVAGSTAVVTDLGGGRFQVEGADVESGEVGLLPAPHVSSETGSFTFTVQALSTESTQEGIAPSVETALSAEKTFEVFLKGVVDTPTVTPGAGWDFDSNTQIIRNDSALEDSLVSLAIGITTADKDGSENINLLISNLPNGVSITNSSGDAVDLAIVDFVNGQPVYQVTLAELQNLYIKPVTDFSGLIEFDIKAVITESDGDAKPDGGSDDNLYQLKVEIDLQPVIDNSATNVNISASGTEDLLVPLKLLPTTNEDSDGSETVTAFSITALAPGMKLYFDGVEIGQLPVDLADYIDATSPSLSELMDSGRFSVKAPIDASGSFNVAISYEVTDTSDSGAQVSASYNDNLLINVNAEVEDLLSPDNDVTEDITRLESSKDVQVSNGNPISLAGVVTFYDQDNDGSETIDYLIITVPKGDNWLVTHPNGAIHDGQGHWLIPADGLTAANIQEVGAEVLAGATIYSSESSLLPVSITVGARVLDGNDELMINTNLFVHFTADGSNSVASDIQTLASAPITADEDNNIDIGSQTLNSVNGDANDLLSFVILASDLPQGGTITGSDVIAVYDSSGKVLIEYLFTQASLDNLQLVGIDAHFAGTFEVPITAIATDGESGDTRIEVQQLQFEIAPVVDELALEAGNAQILEDTYTVLDLQTLFADSNIAGEGIESITSLLLTLPDGGFLRAPVGVLTDNNDGTWTVNDLTRIDKILYKGPLNYSGDINIGYTAQVVDTATGYSGAMTDTGSVSGSFSIEVLPVTDAVNISANSSRGDEDTFIDLTGLAVSFIDDDGSETMSIEISGVPTGAVLVWNGGTILPNNGIDGGSFNGQATYKWSITANQFATLAMKPPLDFSGDIPMKVTVIGYEKGTSDYVTTEGYFVLEVLPIGDVAQVFSVPEALTGSEGQITHFNMRGESSETNSNETLRLGVRIQDEEHIVGLDRIRVDGQEATFVLIGNMYVATLEVNASEFDGFELLSGPDTFGLLDLEIGLSTIDRAIVGGVEEVDIGPEVTFDSTLDLAPVVDIPDLTLNADSIFAVLGSNAPLALELSLVNPALTEKGHVEITGVPAGVSISHATEDGGVWTIAQADLANAMLTALNSVQNFDLTIVPVGELAGDKASGVGQTLAVNVLADSTTNVGNNDNNVIVSGAGDNEMSGGNGDDQFAFNDNGQSSPVTDRISDFTVGSDSLNLTDLLKQVSASSGAQLDAVMDLTESGTDTTLAVKLDGSNVVQNIVLENTSINDLYGGASGFDETAILTKLLDDQTLITGQG